MKYIITENQEQRIHVLRRLNQDWKWISEIVQEGMENDDPCNFKTEEIYLRRICRDSANTYLYNYLDEWRNETFEILSLFIQDLIKERLGNDINEYYRETKEDGCED